MPCCQKPVGGMPIKQFLNHSGFLSDQQNFHFSQSVAFSKIKVVSQRWTTGPGQGSVVPHAFLSE